MKKDIWNLLIGKVENNKLIESTNNPTKSGKYLCTCVNYWNGEEISRYLQIMQYNVEKNYWHDCGNPSGISHTIIAWTNEITPCDYNDFNYISGGVIVEK